MKKIAFFSFLLLSILCAYFSDFTLGLDADVSTGDTAWMLTASALVLLMTPGLAFFYGGIVGRRNVITK